MKPSEFLSSLDDAEIVKAIQEAEQFTSGEIRVYISHSRRENPMEFARRRFAKLGMSQTRDRNAVLLYIVPLTRKFAIVGDTGVHAKCGESFWKETAAEFTQTARNGSITEAIARTVRKIGGLLGEHFPRKPGDTNQLSDRIERSEED